MRKGLDRILGWGCDEEEYSPRNLINFIKEELGHLETFNKEVGVWPGYTLDVHTLAVLESFEKYEFKKRLPKVEGINLVPLMRFALVMHDIGKPKAVEAGNKRLQHGYTQEILISEMERLKFTHSESEFVASLLEYDPIGGAMRDHFSIDQAVEKIKKMSKRANICIKDFFEILTVYFTVDAYAYHTLHHLFIEESGVLIVNHSVYDLIKERIVRAED